jgi:alpha-tubulin suppressor-like RCC1 family protein
MQLCLLAALVLTALNGVAQPVTQIAGGGNHSLFLKSDGSLWAMGDQQYGQLGDGIFRTTDIGTNHPEMIVASNVTAIAAGEAHSLFIESDGSLWAMGLNQYGQLGDGTESNTNRPELIVASNVIAIAAGKDYVGPNTYGHSLFLKSDGSLWGMGANLNGDLSLSNLANYPSPVMIVTSNVTAIAAGNFFNLFIKTDGSLWAMGDGNYGQLGNGTYNATNQPQMIVASNVVAIAAGWYHSLFLKSDGSLWAMGANNAYVSPYFQHGKTGQLGDGTFNNTNLPEMIVASNVTAIAAGDYFSLFIKSDGSLWAMGLNDSGQLGDGTINNTNLPEMIVASNVVTVAAGDDHSLFIKNDGSLWGMGYNNNDELGDGTPIGKIRPEQIVVNPFYNQITGQLLGTGDVQLAFTGIAGNSYALDAATSLAPPNWTPQATNTAGTYGALLFTNTPDPTTNNFWRIRSVP